MTQREADFAAWMAARQPMLLRTAYLLTGDRHTAEDLVQTTLAKMYLRWDALRDHGVLDAYARRVLVNEHTSLWRRAFSRREVPTDELPDVATSAPDGLDVGTSAALWDFVRTLPRKQRAVLVLRFYEELSETETADALGISVGTVKSQCSRALSALRSRVHTVPQLARDLEEER